MHDIVVVSDLHIGRGRSPVTRRFHALETFFFDDDMRRFLRWAVQDSRKRDRALRVAFNGDTFDFLRIEMDREVDESRREQRFGADLTPARAAQLVREILAGHPSFLEALADVLVDGGEIVFLPGNHDLELQWAPVQDAVREEVRSALASRGAADVAHCLSRMSFRSWFLHEPGRIWIEHGCQYDPENSFRYPLRGRLAAGAAEPDSYDPRLTELDMPLGNFFQKYLYNGFGPLTFIVPSTRANARYGRWLLFNEPRLLARVMWNHAPFAWQALRRVARKGTQSRRPMEEAHAAELEELAKESGLGETLREIDALKMVKGDFRQVTREYGVQALQAILGAMAVALGTAGLWSAGLVAIEQVTSGQFVRALLFLALNFAMLTAAVGTSGYLLLRGVTPEPRGPQRKAASRIAGLLGVPVVTFGHTHDEEILPLAREAGPSWFFNTGTWVAVFTHDVLVPRERLQFTFLHVQGHEAELKYWSPGRDLPMPVVLLEEARVPSQGGLATPLLDHGQE